MSTKYPFVSNINLSLAEQVELGKQMTLFGDPEARDKLILNCVPVVVTAAKSFSNHNQISYEDLFQEGMVGVMEAIDRYDYTRNVKFTTFAYCRIIHHLSLWVEKQIKFNIVGICSDSINGMIVDSTVETFYSVFHSYPTDKQLAKLLSVSTQDIAYVKRRWTNPVPFHHRAQPCNSSNISCNPAMATDASSVVESVMCKEYNRKHLLDALDTLDDLERDIIHRRYLFAEKKATLEELAAVHHVDASTVSRREKKALGKILSYFNERGIKPEL